MNNVDNSITLPDIFEPVEFEHTDKLCAFLGDKLCRQYSDIFPLLWLCDYRLSILKRYGLNEMVFNGENDPTKSIIIKKCIYPFQVLGNIFGHKNKNGEIMLSPTVFKSTRYIDFLKQLNQKYTVVKTATACDIDLSDFKNIKKSLKNNIFGNKRYFYGYSVCSKKLKENINTWMYYCLELEKKEVAYISDDSYAESLLSSMQSEFSRLVEKTKKAVAKSNITQYITINQYNVRDLIFATAFSQLGIKTKQYEHHTSRIMHNVINHKKVARYVFVDEICCWNKAELDFHTNVYQYKNILTGKDVEINYVGNPEILIDTAKDSLTRYPEENRITFMVSGLTNIMDPDAVAKDLAFRKSIFEALKKLSDSQQVKVLVRYPPGINMEYRKAEEPYLKELGFEISSSTRENLMEDICKSFAVFGTLSSTLCLSALMGKQVYQITQDTVQYYLTDKNIYTVVVDDIDDIIFDRTPTALNEEDFLNFEKLLKV